MSTVVRLRALFGLLVALASGCQLFSPQVATTGRSPLKPASPSPDSVAMEIVWARFPSGDKSLNDEAWQEIDETQITPSVQRALANNGFRAGIIGGTLPPAISRALHQGEAQAEKTTDPSAAPTDLSPAATDPIELTTEPIVHGRLRRLRRNQRSEIQASEVFPSLPLLVSGGRELGGRTYHEAQAIYALRVDPRPDRTVFVELTPEIHHGQPRVRWTGGDDGILRQAPLRQREVFDQLRMNVRLAPGEMLVLMSLPDAGSRLGHYFHTVDSADGPQQKLILIRLAEVPPSDTFAAAQ
jgi:hypothetical protein